MVTIGDVFAVVATIAGICISAWALIMGVILLFPQRASGARDQLAASPWKSFGVGLALMLTLGTVSLVLLGQPLPIGKLGGWTMLLGLLSVGSIGAAGIGMIASDRLRVLAPELSPYGALSKSAAVLVGAGLVPFLGWFLIAPLVVVFGLGAGVLALVARAKQPGFQL